MVIQRSLGYAGTLDHGIKKGGVVAVGGEQFAGRGDELVCGGAGSLRLSARAADHSLSISRSIPDLRT
jgi:hypothetical protein